MAQEFDKKLRSKEQLEMLRTGLLASDWCGFSKVGTVNELCDLALKGLAASHVAPTVNAAPQAEFGDANKALSGLPMPAGAAPSSTRVNIDAMIDEIITADPYTSYGYVAQNHTVEQDRATKHAKAWMRELARTLGSVAASATRDSILREAFDAVKAHSVPGMKTEHFKGVEEGLERALGAIASLRRADGTGAG